MPLQRRVQDTCTRSGVDLRSAREEQSFYSFERRADGKEHRYLYNIEMYKILRNRIVNTGTQRELCFKDECHKVTLAVGAYASREDSELQERLPLPSYPAITILKVKV